jgi:hypothetical protein
MDRRANRLHLGVFLRVVLTGRDYVAVEGLRQQFAIFKDAHGCAHLYASVLNDFGLVYNAEFGKHSDPHHTK